MYGTSVIYVIDLHPPLQHPADHCCNQKKGVHLVDATANHTYSIRCMLYAAYIPTQQSRAQATPLTLIAHMAKPRHVTVSSCHHTAVAWVPCISAAWTHPHSLPHAHICLAGRLRMLAVDGSAAPLVTVTHTLRRPGACLWLASRRAASSEPAAARAPAPCRTLQGLRLRSRHHLDVR